MSSLCFRSSARKPQTYDKERLLTKVSQLARALTYITSAPNIHVCTCISLKYGQRGSRFKQKSPTCGRLQHPPSRQTILGSSFFQRGPKSFTDTPKRVHPIFGGLHDHNEQYFKTKDMSILRRSHVAPIPDRFERLWKSYLPPRPTHCQARPRGPLIFTRPRTSRLASFHLPTSQ